jgi:ammonium transporter Rh
MITCYMAGIGSIITTYIICQLVQKKVNPLIYTYAMLAGPVAIGSPLLSVNQWGALIIGLIAGALSALAFIYLQPWLCKKIGALDVMGVHNLHGVGGWIGALSAAIIIGSVTNAIAAVGVVIITMVVGGITGGIVRLTRGTITDDMLFTDDSDFIKTEAPPLEALPREVIVAGGTVPADQR